MSGSTSLVHPQTIRVLCVDDDESYTRLLCAVLASEIDMVDVGTVADLDRLVETVTRLCPDVVLLDSEMDGKSPLEVVRFVVRNCPESHVIVMSRSTDKLVASAALDAGARGYVNKSEPPDEVVDAVRRVMRDEIVVSK